MDIETFFNGDHAKRFYFPGKVLIGRGISSKAAELAAQHGSAVLVIDGAFAESDLHQSIRSALGHGKCISCVVRGAPYEQDILAFIAELKEAPEVIISVGGGSAADFAKAIILQHLFGGIGGIGIGEKRGIQPLPGTIRPTYIAIPTTAGSGAEASRYYVAYDKITHSKVYGKTWTVVADWILLDPELLSSMPLPTLVGCAFDAFVHLFETFIAAHERSLFGEMISLDGIPRIMRAINGMVVHATRDDDTHEQLLHSATMAGIAISNVRTGNIHEAGGALLELTQLSHPETLFVFFRDAVEQYLHAIRDREKLLVSRLQLDPAFASFTSMNDVINWWEMIFSNVGLVAKIRYEIGELKPSNTQVREHVVQRVISDKVWISKESPLPLDEHLIRMFIDKSFARFGLET